MKKFLFLTSLALALAGCIYPFDAEVASEDSGGLVVEGDILIGDLARVSLSCVRPFGEYSKGVSGNVWIEDEDGNQYIEDASKFSDSFTINMEQASPDKRYRLRVRLMNPVTGSSSTDYTSDWLEVQPAPSFDKLDYVVDENSIDLKLSLSSPGGSGCFRWDFDEIWQFHAPLQATHTYDPEQGIYIKYKDYTPYYWCWAYMGSYQAGLAIAKSTGGERIVDHDFYSISRDNLRLQTLYYIEVKARGISQECYDYLHTIEVNSTSTGSLTNPEPSQILGNIHSDTDPDEVVIGYIEASRIATKSIYIEAGYYREGHTRYETFHPDPERLNQFYYNGFRPAFPEQSETDIVWIEQRCVDCVAMGGSKYKPPFWPTREQ